LSTSCRTWRPSQAVCITSPSLHPTHPLPQLRILEAKPRAPSGRSLRQVAAGWLLQDADSLHPSQVGVGGWRIGVWVVVVVEGCV